MRSISAENLAALEARQLVARDFLSVWARNRDNGSLVSDHLWSDVGTRTHAVINPDSGLSVDREYHGAFSLVSISDIPLVSNLTVQTISVSLSQISDRVNALVRQYDVKQGRIEIHRGLYNPARQELVAPAEPRFVGFVDQVEITTPGEGSEGSCVLRCVSHTQELTRYNPDTRSDASQRRRLAHDAFYQDTTVVAEWEHFWGKASGPIPTTTAHTGRFGFGTFTVNI